MLPHKRQRLLAHRGSWLDHCVEAVPWLGMVLGRQRKSRSLLELAPLEVWQDCIVVLLDDASMASFCRACRVGVKCIHGLL